jgi:YaiO family outer membrane protein
MGPHKTALSLLALLVPLCAQADVSEPRQPAAQLNAETLQGAPEAQTTIGLNVGREHLSNGTPDWKETAIDLKRDLGPRHVVDVSLVETERFGLSDTQFNALYAFPLGDKLTATVDGNLSGTHRVLAENTIGGSLQYEFAPAWLVHGGARSIGYNDVRVNQGLLMLEHYLSNFSWLAAWRPSRAFGTTANAFELRGSYYYGDKSSITLLLADGKEAAAIGTDVTLTSVHAIALIGHHWFNSNWALNYSLGHTRQGDLYTRDGVSLGVQYHF